jgi:hypothetical protein
VLTDLLERAAEQPAIELDEVTAVQLLKPYLELLEAIGDGENPTGAGFLPPAVDENRAERTCLT